MKFNLNKASRNLANPLRHKTHRTLPVFLCPILSKKVVSTHVSHEHRRALGTSTLALLLSPELQTACSSASSQNDTPAFTEAVPLPAMCSGCGALNQTANPREAGFYSISRRSVKAFIAQDHTPKLRNHTPEDRVLQSVIEKANHGLLKELGLGTNSSGLDHSRHDTSSAPVCDRCHNLLHHHSGASIDHPSLQLIEDTISESPYNYNHIYHVIDAADFPLSFIPNLHRHLALNPQRSRNRRAKYLHGRRGEITFVITRSDLLAPKKEQVDSLMPYLVQVLRDALGASGREIRLGNVRCVSSQRGWWSKEIKEDIWRRGGGGWLVGKVNVGKSRLFESVFPKGRSEDPKHGKLRKHTNVNQHVEGSETHVSGFSMSGDHDEQGIRAQVQSAEGVEELTDDISLLPPLRLETQFPDMPIVSSLPGTTASPIRLPFGSGKGELIDLPGLSRGNLDAYVRNEHKIDLVMRTRVNPEQQVLKRGQSLLLGGLIRITPANQDIVILAYPFVPLEAHVTSTDKAVGIQTQQRQSGVDIILEADVGSKMAFAGSFPLKWDITKQRSGPLTSPAAAGLSAERLPYRVLGTDILIEGCGWVELVAQVRKSKLDGPSSSIVVGSNDGENQSDMSVSTEQHADLVPMVEVFSPEGRHIGTRRPMNAWRFSSEKKVAVNKGKRRPRPSMKGSKKSIKLAQSQR